MIIDDLDVECFYAGFDIMRSSVLDGLMHINCFWEFEERHSEISSTLY